MQELRDKITDSLRRDPRRTAVLCLLLTLLGIMIWRFQSGGPASAGATSEEAAASATAAGPADISRSADLAAKWRQQPVPHLSRNLFSSELTMPLPEAGGTARQSDSVAEPNGLFWRQLEQALAARADRDQYRQSLGEAALRDVAELNLSSIVVGPDSWAMIDSKVVRLGDILGTGERGPFTVVAIEAKRVILARDGHRIELLLGRAQPQLLSYE